MTNSETTTDLQPSLGNRFSRSTFVRVLNYTVLRALVLLVMLGIGIYLAVIVANFGGFIDAIYRANIEEALNFMPPPQGLTPEQVNQFYLETRAAMEEAYGLGQPFLIRSARWAWKAAIFDWGVSYRFRTLDGTSSDVRDIVFERLGNTVLLFGVANLLVFGSSILTAFVLFRHYGSWPDRVISNLSVISSVPMWIIGAILTALFAIQLNVLPYAGMYGAPSETWLGTALGIGRHMILPMAAIFIGLYFHSVSMWRALFLLQSGEDYVELARAKGLPEKVINRRHLMRPTLPYIITSLAMIMIGVWQNSIALELWFDWPGVGQLLFQSIGGGNIDRNTVLAIIVSFAYLLAITVFLLDIVYALLDPRVRIGAGGDTVRMSRTRRRFPSWRRSHAPQPDSVIKPAAHPKRDSVFVSMADSLRHAWSSIKPIFRDLRKSPSAMVGLAMVAILFAVSLYTIIAIPYNEIILKWRPDIQNWYENPKNARPVWVNLFRSEKLPPTIDINSRVENVPRTVEQVEGVGEKITLSYKFDYVYDDIPQDLNIYFNSEFSQKKPFITISWITPDGRTIELPSFSIVHQTVFYALDDKRMKQRYGKPEEIMGMLFTDPQTGEIVKGTYEMQVQAATFEPGNNLDARMILYGKVFGMAGTDDNRRDLSISLLWGAPVALTFGVVGAVFTTLATVSLAAAGVWFGGWVDNFIQRLSEISMILPALPIAMMVFFLYSKTVWAILGVIILLSIFGNSLKNYRAALLQSRDAPYIEAARVYGASNGRIIVQYLLPRIMPLFVTQLIVLVPSFIFLEATLAFLKVSDIYLPTWGKMIYDAMSSGSLAENAYWFLEPVTFLLLTGLAFVMIAVALDRVLNPRLRTH